MTISLAVESDVAAILAIANWAAANTPANFATEPEPLSMWLETFRATSESHPWLVMREGDRVVGFAKGSPHRARGAYRWSAETSVYVDPEFHGRGIGRALYRVLVPMLRAQGYMTLLAGITPNNPASERLHESLGFERCGTYAKVGWKFGKWHDVGYWELHLQLEYLPPSELLPASVVWPKVRAGLAKEIATERVLLDTPGVDELIASLNAELQTVYPEPGANHFRLDPNEVKGNNGAFLLARLDGEAVGCGAIRITDADGEGPAAELKRMYVPPRWRGLGVSKAVLGALEDLARKLGAKRAVLETGSRQLAAVGLYERCGYAKIPLFGEYLASPLTSLCMGKDL